MMSEQNPQRECSSGDVMTQAVPEQRVQGISCPCSPVSGRSPDNEISLNGSSKLVCSEGFTSNGNFTNIRSNANSNLNFLLEEELDYEGDDLETSNTENECPEPGCSEGFVSNGNFKNVHYKENSNNINFLNFLLEEELDYEGDGLKTSNTGNEYPEVSEPVNEDLPDARDLDDMEILVIEKSDDDGIDNGEVNSESTNQAKTFASIKSKQAKYATPPAVLKKPPPKNACLHFSRGKCTRGENCKFLHTNVSEERHPKIPRKRAAPPVTHGFNINKRLRVDLDDASTSGRSFSNSKRSRGKPSESHREWDLRLAKERRLKGKNHNRHRSVDVSATFRMPREYNEIRARSRRRYEDYYNPTSNRRNRGEHSRKRPGSRNEPFERAKPCVAKQGTYQLLSGARERNSYRQRGRSPRSGRRFRSTNRNSYSASHSSPSSTRRRFDEASSPHRVSSRISSPPRKHHPQRSRSRNRSSSNYNYCSQRSTYQQPKFHSSGWYNNRSLREGDNFHFNRKHKAREDTSDKEECLRERHRLAKQRTAVYHPEGFQYKRRSIKDRASEMPSAFDRTIVRRSRRENSDPSGENNLKSKNLSQRSGKLRSRSRSCRRRSQCEKCTSPPSRSPSCSRGQSNFSASCSESCSSRSRSPSSSCSLRSTSSSSGECSSRSGSSSSSSGSLSSSCIDCSSSRSGSPSFSGGRSDQTNALPLGSPGVPETASELTVKYSTSSKI